MKSYRMIFSIKNRLTGEVRISEYFESDSLSEMTLFRKMFNNEYIEYKESPSWEFNIKRL